MDVDDKQINDVDWIFFLIIAEVEGSISLELMLFMRKN